MEVTEIRIKLAENHGDKLLAFCTITFDNCFVVRDLKVINGAHGVFVAMPSRKLTDLCPYCNAKNHLRAGYCNDCGARLDPDRAERDAKGRAKLHADVAHPIHCRYRDELQRLILDAYREELRRPQPPGSRAASDGFADVGYDASELYEDEEPAPRPRRRDKAKRPQHRFGEGILP